MRKEKHCNIQNKKALVCKSVSIYLNINWSDPE